MFILYFPPIYPSSIIIFHSIVHTIHELYIYFSRYISKYSVFQRMKRCYCTKKKKKKKSHEILKMSLQFLIDRAITFDLIKHARWSLQEKRENNN